MEFPGVRGGWMNMENFIYGYPGSESGVRS
jgi:hypothetical protein